MTRQTERELDQLDEDLANGTISKEEHRIAIREIEMADREAAEEAARDAYNRVLDSWW